MLAQIAPRLSRSSERDDREKCTCTEVSSAGFCAVRSVSALSWVPLVEVCSFAELPFAALSNNAPTSCFCKTAQPATGMLRHVATLSSLCSALHSRVISSNRCRWAQKAPTWEMSELMKA